MHSKTATRMPSLSGVKRPFVVAVATSNTYRPSALKPGAPSRSANVRSTLDQTYSLLTIFAVLTTPNLANKYGNKPKAGPGEIKCGFPSCNNLVFYYSTTGHYDFCGMTCREIMANLPVTPPMLELTCTRFTRPRHPRTQPRLQRVITTNPRASLSLTLLHMEVYTRGPRFAHFLLQTLIF